jgi:thiamine-monophosphate kinase
MPKKAFESEFEFVRWLRRMVPDRQGRLKLGIGDDAAVIAVGRGHELILTTDLSIEGVHFSRRLDPPRSVGHRALARSLSDVAAMGGTPRFALVSLAISRQTPRRWVEEFYAGLLGLAKRFGVTLIGGDTAVVGGPTGVDVIVAGETPAGRALLRSGARPGDYIFVSGRLGLSALGLHLLKQRRHAGRKIPPPPTRPAGFGDDAVLAHLYPQPRCALGAFLARRRLASAMIDVSDGLSTDLANLCAASGVGALLREEEIPGPFRDQGVIPQGDARNLALHGGEDYELLFTVPPQKARHVPRQHLGVRLHCIGAIQRSEGVLLMRADGTKQALQPEGWDHFRNRRD